MSNPDKCYCLEIFRKKYGNHVTGNCLKLDCQRYRRENNLPPKDDKKVKRADIRPHV